MRYALVNGLRSIATPQAKGICEGCGNPTVAKCGSRVIHHWAHLHLPDCDPWWKNKTQWHIDWQNRFPEQCREVWHSTQDGIQHRADIKTPTGIVIEVQHSAMNDAERISREEFYGNLVWIIDGSRFRGNFDLYHCLPKPSSALAKDLVWFKVRRHKGGTHGGIFWRRSENPDAGNGEGMVEVHGFDRIREAVEADYVGHHQYDWIRPHRTWLDAKCPVYIDFGEPYLLRMEYYGATLLPCVRLVAKSDFVREVMTKHSIHEIANWE